MPCELEGSSPDGCFLCDAPLPGRRLKWCSDECSHTYWANHDWNKARRAALQRDGWQCIRCGHIGWNDVPTSVLAIRANDPDLDPFGTTIEDWAVALGLLTAEQATFSAFQIHNQQARSRALEQLPAVLTELVTSERRRSRFGDPRVAARHGPASHELEVNHITPRRGRGYHNGCHHHLDNLETLCRPCHTDETNRQRRGLPSWREDPTPIGLLMGQLPLEASQ